LIVDEVLAVGDVAFQKKCVGKMEETAQGNRTVLIVSHNMQLIRMLCGRTICLDQGAVVMDAPSAVTLKAHDESMRAGQSIGDDSLHDRLRRTSGAVRFTDIKAANADGHEKWSFVMGETIKFTLPYKVHADVQGLGLYLAISASLKEEIITSVKGVLSTSPLRYGESGIAVVELPNIALRPGDYSVYVALGDTKFERYYDVIDQNVSVPVLSITSTDLDHHLYSGWFSIAARVFPGHALADSLEGSILC
jgi:lipopolysaccharide transport system ATP-binding protein